MSLIRKYNSRESRSYKKTGKWVQYTDFFKSGAQRVKIKWTTGKKQVMTAWLYGPFIGKTLIINRKLYKKFKTKPWYGFKPPSLFTAVFPTHSITTAFASKGATTEVFLCFLKKKTLSYTVFTSEQNIIWKWIYNQYKLHFLKQVS